MKKKYVFRWLKFQLWRLLRKILRQHGSEHAIALGATIGVFVSMTPTVGLQMALGILIATLVGANRIAAAVPAWITNPVTIVPIYTFNYWLGTLFVGGAGIDDFKQEFTLINSQLAEAGFAGITPALGSMLALGKDMLIPLVLGCTLVGVVLALPTYPLILKAVISFRKNKQQKKNDRHKRVSTRISSRKNKKSVFSQNLKLKDNDTDI